MSVTILLAAALVGQTPAEPEFSTSMPDADVAYEEMQAGRNHAAIQQLREALKENPDDPATLINLGTAYARAGNVEKAREQFDAAMRSDQRYTLELANGRWVDSRRAARMASSQLLDASGLAIR